MKSAKLIKLALAIAVFAVTQFGCAMPENTNTASTNTNTAVPEATPDKAAIETELLKIENDWGRVIKERDVEAVTLDDVNCAAAKYFEEQPYVLAIVRPPGK